MLTDTTAAVPTIRRVALERLVDDLSMLDWNVNSDDVELDRAWLRKQVGACTTIACELLELEQQRAV